MINNPFTDMHEQLVRMLAHWPNDRDVVATLRATKIDAARMVFPGQQSKHRYDPTKLEPVLEEVDRYGDGNYWVLKFQGIARNISEKLESERALLSWPPTEIRRNGKTIIETRVHTADLRQDVEETLVVINKLSDIAAGQTHPPPGLENLLPNDVVSKLPEQEKSAENVSQADPDPHAPYFPSRSINVNSDLLGKDARSGRINFIREGNSQRQYSWPDCHKCWPHLVPKEPPNPSIGYT